MVSCELAGIGFRGVKQIFKPVSMLTSSTLLSTETASNTLGLFEVTLI